MTCYLCGNSNVSVIRTNLRHDVERNVLRCTDCGFVRLEPKDENLQEYYREEYRRQFSPNVDRETSPEETYTQYLPFQDDRIRRVTPHVEESMRVLEIGCSTGHFLAALKPLVGERVGLEYNSSHAEFVRKQLGIQVYTEPIENTDRPRNSFDMIFMFHVFEHVPDPREFLSGLGDYLAPDGKVYIEVPNVHDALLDSYGVPAYADFYYKTPHLFYFSPSTFLDLAGQAGFTGQLEMIQRYSLANHFHWVTAGDPQSDPTSGMQIPRLIPDDGASDPEFSSELGDWLAKSDREYRELLARHQKTESMAFLGHRR